MAELMDLKKAIAEKFPTPQRPDTSSHLFEYPDILTDHEKDSVLSWELKKARENLLFRLLEKGMPTLSAELLVSQKDWDAELNRDEILALANKRKHFAEIERQYKSIQGREDAAKMAEIQKEWTAKRFYETIKSHFIAKHGVFHGYNWQKQYIRAVCLMMSNDARFEAEMGYSFNRGLMVTGTGGHGKTEIIKSIAGNPFQPVRVISMLQIARQVKDAGFCDLKMSVKTLIDDVGTEPEIINHYGTKVNWFKDFIENYHFDSNDFSNLILAHNLGGDEIEARYGYRVRSRLREMMNVIHLAGNDLRK
jgi:hypothetical protein